MSEFVHVGWRNQMGSGDDVRWAYYDGVFDPREVHDNGKPWEKVYSPVAKPMPMDRFLVLRMAARFREAHDEHAKTKIYKIYAAGQREEANVIVGLRAALEVIGVRL